MSRHYCTYFDHHYYPQGRAMMESLRRHEPDARFTVLGLSPECQELLHAVAGKNTTVITMSELESAYPELLAAKESRSCLEYYFTCTPFLLQYVMASEPHGTLVTYLDADLGFFADPAPLYDEIGNHSIAIVPRRIWPGISFTAPSTWAG